MFFVLQNPNDKREMLVDQTVLRDLLNHAHAEYVELFLRDLQKERTREIINEAQPRVKNAIPLGSVEFANEYLKQYCGIEQMNPIEVPKCLRTREFLKRGYKIVAGRDIPKYGEYFVKDASNLKYFSYTGDVSKLHEERLIDADTLYVLSEIKKFSAEYRAYFLSGKLYAVAYYNGDPTVQPDMNLIKKANQIYSMQRDYPGSYTMDVMVGEDGTSIVEIHIMFACGLYTTVLGIDFLNAYTDAMKYTKKYNTPITAD